MFEVNDYVSYKDTETPIGKVEAVKDDVVTVYWGTIDRKTFRDDIPSDQLQKVSFDILSPDEVVTNEAERKAEERTRLTHQNIFDKKE